MFTIESEDNFFIVCTDEQDFCRDNSSEKLKPGIEKSWLIDWLLGVEEGWGSDTADTSEARPRVGAWNDKEGWSSDGDIGAGLGESDGEETSGENTGEGWAGEGLGR